MRLRLVQMRALTTRAARSWSGARSGTQTAGGGLGQCTQTPLVCAGTFLLTLASGHGPLLSQQLLSFPEVQKGQSSVSSADQASF